MSADPAGMLVHGMGADLAEPDWAPLTDAEVSAVLAGYPLTDASRAGRAGGAGTGEDGAADAVVTWRSPRPMSAAALVRRGGTTV
ncbi:MAG: hypothetical protein J2P32_03215, partial [Actinobacteria bacterium]|nr:hypothetical protein [Actinomycetota bacterium]